MSMSELSAALAALIERDDAAWLYDALQAVIRLQTQYPVALTGSAAVVDPVRQFALSNPDALPRLVSLVDAKRAARGLPPLVPPPDDKFDKTEYMRDFMEKKRQRLRRAVEIENFARPERDALRGRARLDYMDTQAAKWKAELDARIKRAREAAGGPLDRELLVTLRSQFWTWVDSQLDDAEEAARRKLKP